MLKKVVVLLREPQYDNFLPKSFALPSEGL